MTTINVSPKAPLLQQQHPSARLDSGSWALALALPRPSLAVKDDLADERRLGHLLVDLRQRLERLDVVGRPDVARCGNLERFDRVLAVADVALWESGRAMREREEGVSPRAFWS